jgi:hypothetical protein
MKFNSISLDEMKAALEGWTEVTGSTATREYVYEKAIPENAGIVVRIFTSIHKDTSIARRCGGDAIRICAVNVPAHKGWISTVKVLRVEGWRANLNKAINKVMTEARSRWNRNHPTRQLHRPITFVAATPLTFSTWTKSGTSYVTESSDLNAATFQGHPRNICPHCNGLFNKKDIIKIDKDASGEDIYGWHFRCPTCKTELLVIND